MILLPEVAHEHIIEIGFNSHTRYQHEREFVCDFFLFWGRNWRMHGRMRREEKQLSRSQYSVINSANWINILSVQCAFWKNFSWPLPSAELTCFVLSAHCQKYRCVTSSVAYSLCHSATLSTDGRALSFFRRCFREIWFNVAFSSACLTFASLITINQKTHPKRINHEIE